MSSSRSRSITQLLLAAAHGERAAHERLWALVYAELRRMAADQLRHEGQGRGLRATSLVNEAYLRLVGPEPLPWENRRHFFAAAAEAMRRIRVEKARRRKRLKRGGGRAPDPLRVEPLVADADPGEVLAVDEALNRLRAEHPRAADVVMLRYFAGLGVRETAAALGMSARAVQNDWRFARAWLHRALNGNPRTTC